MDKIIINAIPLEAFQLLIEEVFHVLILSDMNGGKFGAYLYLVLIFPLQNLT